jgi:hypothetical protein
MGAGAGGKLLSLDSTVPTTGKNKLERGTKTKTTISNWADSDTPY